MPAQVENLVPDFLHRRGFGLRVVSCADVILKENQSGQAGTEAVEDIGIVAFGWNNAPFGFAGRAGEWVGDCANPLS